MKLTKLIGLGLAITLALPQFASAVSMQRGLNLICTTEGSGIDLSVTLNLSRSSGDLKVTNMQGEVEGEFSVDMTNVQTASLKKNSATVIVGKSRETQMDAGAMSHAALLSMEKAKKDLSRDALFAHNGMVHSLTCRVTQ